MQRTSTSTQLAGALIILKTPSFVSARDKLMHQKLSVTRHPHTERSRARGLLCEMTGSPVLHVAVYVRWHGSTVEPRSSRFTSSTYANVNTIISTFRDASRRFVMKARGWGVGIPNSPVIAQFILSFAQFCLSISQVDFFCVSWHENLCQSFYAN